MKINPGLIHKSRHECEIPYIITEASARLKFGLSDWGGKKITTNPYIGSSLDDLLEEDGVLEEVEAIAIKRSLAWQVSQLMQEKGLTKTAMAQEMNTSRASLDRFLDPENTSVTLNTMVNAAKVVGKRLRIDLV